MSAPMLRVRASGSRANARHACPQSRNFKRSTRAHASLQADGTLQNLHKWYIEQRALQPPGVEAVLRDVEHFGQQPCCLSTRDTQAGEAICQIPQDAAVTSTDAAKHPLVGALAEGRGDITSLALWLLAERSSKSTKANSPFVDALPETTMSPILWDDKFRKTELKGSPVLEQSREREAALRAEWADIAAAIAALPNSGDFAATEFSDDAFLRAACVVLAHAIYLPSAQCFALLPFVSLMQRTGNGDGCDVDYDAETACVVVTAQRALSKESHVKLNDPRPNGERLLATGAVQEDNASDYLLFEAELVKSDRLYTSKHEVLQSLGIQDTEFFPLYINRFPIQLLSFLRLSRIQDIAQLALITFEQDQLVSQLNEYEVLQLVMGDMRERLAGYIDNQEEDMKNLQDPTLTPRDRLAIMQRYSEKNILLSTTDAIRTRLAPIRGIPTKSGKMEDPNKDLLEIFETIEGVGSAPQKLWSSFSRWASGKDDPDFKR